MKEVLLHLPIFAGLDRGALDLLLAAAREIHVAAGGLLVVEGEPGNEMFLIATGHARVCKGMGTVDEVVLATFGPLDFFGEMCILETLGRSASVVAQEDCVVFGLKSSAFLRLYQQMPSQHGILIVNLARDLSRRLRRMDGINAALR